MVVLGSGVGCADPALTVPPREEDGGEAEGEDGERGGGEIDGGGGGGWHARMRGLASLEGMRGALGLGLGLGLRFGFGG